MKNFNSLVDVLSTQPAMLLAEETYTYLLTYYNISPHEKQIEGIVSGLANTLSGYSSAKFYDTLESDILTALKSITAIKGVDKSFVRLIVLVRLCFVLYDTKVFDKLDSVLPPHLRIRKLLQILVESETLEARLLINKKLYVSWQDACKQGNNNVKDNQLH